MVIYRSPYDLYQKTFKSYTTYLSRYGDIALSHYCREHHVFYSGMKRWMNTKNISVTKIRQSYTKKCSLHNISPSLPPIPSSSIFPISITNADNKKLSPQSFVVERISKVKITYPTGVVIEVEEISYTSLKDLLFLSIH